MKKLLNTLFAFRKTLLLMMLGIFIVGCAQDTDEIEDKRGKQGKASGSGHNDFQ